MLSKVKLCLWRAGYWEKLNEQGQNYVMDEENTNKAGNTHKIAVLIIYLMRLTLFQAPSKSPQY